MPVAEAPRVTKTMVKPQHISMTDRIRCPLLFSGSYTEEPRMKEKYAGISGNTQGEKKEIIPARKLTPTQAYHETFMFPMSSAIESHKTLLEKL